MADLYNDFPSWGETGAFPADGFFYQGGDQVNEKHMDALWNGVKVHLDRLITGIEDRVKHLEGDSILDGGLVASQGTNTREVDVSASNAGAYVDGQFTGSTSATTLTLSTNGGTSTRTDSIFVDINGNVGATEGTTSVGPNRHKIAEVDVATNDTISAIRNTGRDTAYHFASEVHDPGQVPGGTRPGDLWHDKGTQRINVYQNGAFRTLITEQDDVTISGGDGLKNGNTIDLVGGGTLSLDVEPADFAGNGVKDDGADNIAVEPADFAGTYLSDDGADNLTANLGTGVQGDGSGNIALNESVIKDGGAKQIDAQELAGGSGTAGQFLKTDGANASWASLPTTSISDGGTFVLDSPNDINFGSSLGVTDDGDGSVTVDATTTDTRTDVSENGTTVVTDTKDINFSGRITAVDDGDGTSTVSADVQSSYAEGTYTSGNPGVYKTVSFNPPVKPVAWGVHYPSNSVSQDEATIYLDFDDGTTQSFKNDSAGGVKTWTMGKARPLNKKVQQVRFSHSQYNSGDNNTSEHYFIGQQT